MVNALVITKNDSDKEKTQVSNDYNHNVNHSGEVKITTGAASAIGSLFKILFKIAGVLLIILIIGVIIGVIYDNKNTKERNIKLSQSWSKPATWSQLDEQMLQDCVNRKHYNSKIPYTWDEDKMKYVSSYITNDGSAKVIIYSGKPITNNFYDNPPKAFEGQAIMCQYNVNTQEYLGSIYSMNGKWFENR